MLPPASPTGNSTAILCRLEKENFQFPMRALPPAQPLVVFTDLDGTLIDHHDYSPEGSREAMKLLAERDVPLVFCSSKTFAEQIFLQKQLGLAQPFIIENGSAVAVPRGYFTSKPIRFLKPYRFEEGYEIFSLAHADSTALRSELAHFQNIKGFSDASNDELAAATGLAGDALQRARARWFTETLLTPLEAGQVEFLNKKLGESGFVLSRGGRFFTVQSAQTDKGKAVRWLADVFRKNMETEPVFAATGDSPNDAPMLAAVDFPFLVQKPGGVWTDLEIPGLIKVEGVGPAGFSAAVRRLLGKEI
jgi:mannosyl-3-phosphoglycerate phosphatase family protein